MQWLSAYNEETDSDEGDDTLSSTQTTTSGPARKTYENDASVVPSSSGQNFFGLGDLQWACTSEADAHADADISCETSVKLAGYEVHIPNSDFWKDFTLSDIGTPGPKATLKRKATYVHEPSPPEKMKLNKDTLNRNANLIAECPWEKPYPAPSNSTSSTDTKSSLVCSNSDSSSAVSSACQNDFTVKLYSVHPKIASHLNSNQANKCTKGEIHHWAGHTGVINRLTWCTAVPFSHLLASASMDTTVKVWNVWAQQQPCVRTLSIHRKAVRDAQWSADGYSILSSSYDRTAATTDVQTGQTSVQLDHSSFVSAAKFHPVSPHLLATGTTDCIQVWDTRSPDVPCRVFTYKEQLGQVQDLLFSRDGQEMFSCSDIVTRDSSDRSIMAWDFRTGVILSNQIFQERYTVTRLCLHPSNSQFLAQTQAGYIALFSTQRPYKMNRNKRFEGHKTAGYNIGMSVSRDGSVVYSGCSQGKLHCYNFQTGKRIRTVDCGGVLLDAVAHPVLPSVVAGATWGGTIHLFQ